MGSKACAPCHGGIYKRYIQSGMARSAGAVGTAEAPESFAESAFQAGGVDYRVSPYFFEFARPGSDVAGKVDLQWFIGSGNLGRSYLFGRDGFLFQAPVSYYSRAGAWDISPGYRGRGAVDLTRAVEPACLQCHASGLQPRAGTVNGFASPPFREGGVSCERCHGPGKSHIVSRSAKAIVQPAKLTAERRDSVCAQCHLTGLARVARAKAEPYRPGALLSASVAVFVDGRTAAGASATGHFEQMSSSGCKLASGDKFWCGSCHDPHEQPRADVRVEYFRGKCLTCHTRLPKEHGMDCIGCHMPQSKSVTAEHLAFTDHRIRRRPSQAAASSDAPNPVSFWQGSDARDEALGYAVLAMTQPAVRRQALQLLEAAAAKNPRDVPVLAQLAQFYDRMGQEEKALVLCERVLALDAGETAVAINLGGYLAKRGRLNEAISLWQKALARNPGLTGARMNLAVAQAQLGHTAAARGSLEKLLSFAPDDDKARQLLRDLAFRQ